MLDARLEKTSKPVVIIRANLWRDLNGNTQHKVYVDTFRDSKYAIVHLESDIVYGYGETYRETALDMMIEAGWIEPGTKHYDLHEKVNYLADAQYVTRKKDL